MSLKYWDPKEENGGPKREEREETIMGKWRVFGFGRMRVSVSNLPTF